MTKTAATPLKDPPDGVLSAVSSVKEIVTVVMALTMTNTLVLLLTQGHYSQVRSLSDLPPKETIFSGLLILTIFRFYHGNVRHLDSVYRGETGTLHMVKPAPRGGLGVDFFVILAQSVLFGVMSFYASDPQELLLLFIFLLGSDVFWALIVQQPTEDNAAFDHQRKWLLYNFLAGSAVIAIYSGIVTTKHPDALIYAGAAVMLLNSVIDFAINWNFYFPGQGADCEERTVFLAAPLTQLLDGRSGCVQAEYRAWLEGLIAALERAGHKVASAHMREEWGECLDSPTSALSADLEDLRRSQAIVAHVGSPPSPGVQFELGVATSLGLPMVLLLDKGKPAPYLNPALPTVSRTDVLELDGRDKSYERVVQALAKLLAPAV